MRLSRFVLRFSLFANIVLILWALSQRTKIQERETQDEATLAALDQAVVDLHQANDHSKIQLWRMISNGEQLEALVEEHKDNGK